MMLPLTDALDEAQGTAWDVLWVSGGNPSLHRAHHFLMPAADWRDTPAPPTEQTRELIRRLLSGEQPVEAIDPEGRPKRLPPGFFLDCQLEVDRDLAAHVTLQALFNGRSQGPIYRYPSLVALQTPVSTAAAAVSPGADGKPRYANKRNQLERTARQALADHPELRGRHGSARSAAKEIAGWFVPPPKSATVEKYIRGLWAELPKP